MIYGAKIKEIREEMGFTQKNIAQELDIYKGLYSQYETEYEIIPTKHLNTLCNYFEVSLDYIFNFTDVKQYKSSIKDIDKMLAGKRLKEFRKENKITQVGLANTLNTVQPVIANYEKGKHLIATPFLYMICSKYKVSADYLLGKIDYKPY